MVDKAFPFHFVVDKDLIISKEGTSLHKISSGQSDFNKAFDIVRPTLESNDYTSLSRHCGQLFILKLKGLQPDLSLKGSFFKWSEEVLAFLGSPCISSEEDLKNHHLLLTDFGVLDPVLDIIHLNQFNKNYSEDLKALNKALTIKNSELMMLDTEMKKLFQLSQDFMCVANTKGYFLKINPIFNTVLGYEENELLKNKFLDYVHPEDLPSTIRELEKLAQGKLTINFENRYKKANGSYIYINWNCTPDPETGLLYATARDMTEHRENIMHEKQLILEKEKSIQNEKMLHKLLPPTIAKRMQMGEIEIADYFPQVSILFADIVNFSGIVQYMPAITVRKFLTLVFNHFDNLVLQHGCEKIKTIGDGYMAIAGAPEICEDHSERLTSAALDMIIPPKIPDEIMEYFVNGNNLSFRIGMHVGSIVGGVLGNNRPMSYDVWGDAVNIASRMQSSSEPNKIHVSSHFVMHLKNRYAITNVVKDIHFLNRGDIEIKHMGKINTYYLLPGAKTVSIHPHLQVSKEEIGGKSELITLKHSTIESGSAK